MKVLDEVLMISHFSFSLTIISDDMLLSLKSPARKMGLVYDA